MKFNHVLIAAGAAFLVSNAHALPSAVATSTSSAPFDYFFFEGYSAGAPSGGLFLDSIDIDGLAKFDPALGTLTGVRADVFFEYDYEVLFDGSPPPGDGDDFEASVVLDGFFFDLVLAEDPLSSGRGVGKLFTVPDFEGTALGCAGVTPDGCFDGGPVSGLLLEETDIDLFDDNVPLSTFVGPGPLESERLSFGVAFPEGLTFDDVFGNFDSLGVSVDIFGSGEVVLTYEYTPVPLPAAWPALTLALAVLARGRRRAA